MNIYMKRQDRLSDSLQTNSMVVIFSNNQVIRSNDTEYPFRQNSNFYYLTGVLEENSALVIIKDKNNLISTYLFLKDKITEQSVWNGPGVSLDKIIELGYTQSNILYISTFTENISKFLSNIEYLYFDIFNIHCEYNLLDICKSLNNNRKIFVSPKKFIDIIHLIEKKRLIKSNDEINIIKKALLITKKAHISSMKKCKPNIFEYQLQANYEYEFKNNGAYNDAYTSIVASGNNANTLHYIENKDLLKTGDLILADAGCEFNMYSSDITRIYPVNGKFGESQSFLYNKILNIQKYIITLIKPDITFEFLQQKTEVLISKLLIELKILNHFKLEQILEDKLFKKYYPHGIGHWMGIDVHDQNPYRDEKGELIKFQEGMVLTIEPGLYLQSGDNNIPIEYQGIGIRIEDNILVTNDGYDNLSIDIIKEIKDIEEVMK